MPKLPCYKLALTFLLILISFQYQLAPNKQAIAQQVTVNAIVPAEPSDYSAELTVTSSDNPVQQNQTLTFNITYGTSLTYPTTIIVEADWTLGTIAGEVAPSLPVLQYITNSATNGYNNTAPVIDLTNKKISWTIPAFPGNTTDQTVTFELKTIDTYSEPKHVQFTVNGRLLGPGVATPDSSITRSYKYRVGPVPTKTPAPLPTSVVTPTPAGNLFTFQNITVDTISTSSAGLLIRTSQPSAITIQYGTTPQSLPQRIRSAEWKTEHLLNIAGLQRDTAYFFRLFATDTTGKTIQSDIYTFKTASRDQTIVIEPDSLIISNKDVILHYAAIKEHVVVVPQNIPFSVQFKVTDPQTVKYMQLFLRNNQTLGVNNYSVEGAGYPISGPMQMIKPGIYAGKLIENALGRYELYSKLSDHNGNITEQRLFSIRIVPPMAIHEEGTKLPIENAKIHLALYNPVTKIFEPISQAMTGIPNPVFSQYTGIVPIVLPTNRYKATVSATGYESKEVTFSIGDQHDAIYPTVYLKKLPFSIITFAYYLGEVTLDNLQALQETVSLFALSSRSATLAAAIIITCFVILTFLSFSARTRVPLLHMPHFFAQHMHRGKTTSMQGLIQDDTNKPIPHARVLLLNGDIILAQTTTNKQGEFHSKVPAADRYIVEVFATGFMPAKQTLAKDDTMVQLVLSQKKHIPWHEIITNATAWVMGWLFELLLFLSFLIELTIGFTWGLGHVAPFLFLSLLNAVLWGLYVYRHKP